MIIIENEMNKWLSEAFSSEKNFKQISGKLEAIAEKGEGYLSNIVFVTATALTSTGETKVFNLIVKVGKNNENFDNKLQIRLLYENEIYFYKVGLSVLSAFDDNRLNLIENLMPKYFGSVLRENEEVLILENLKKVGYVLNECEKPFGYDHFKLTFENYGKFHALSMAYRDQKPKEYEDLFELNLANLFKPVLPLAEMILFPTEKELYQLLEENGEHELLERLHKKIPENLFITLKKFLNMQSVEKNNALLHGDCWNNNFMFKYDDNIDHQFNKPLAVKYLDFQLAATGSPVTDLAYHFFCNASVSEFERLKELIPLYYESLSDSLRKLGSDPEKLFPYTELQRQWKKYSLYGIILTIYVLPLTLLGEKNDIKDVNILTIIASIRRNSNNTYVRLRNILRFYVENEDI